MDCCFQRKLGFWFSCPDPQLGYYDFFKNEKLLFKDVNISTFNTSIVLWIFSICMQHLPEQLCISHCTMYINVLVNMSTIILKIFYYK